MSIKGDQQRITANDNIRNDNNGSRLREHRKCASKRIHTRRKRRDNNRRTRDFCRIDILIHRLNSTHTRQNSQQLGTDISDAGTDRRGRQMSASPCGAFATKRMAVSTGTTTNGDHANSVSPSATETRETSNDTSGRHDEEK